MTRSEDLIGVIRERWDTLTILGATHSTTSYKLTDERVENCRVDEDGLVHFELERHGRAVLGSPYADVHSWTVDLKAGTAWITGIKPRLIGERSRPVNTKAVVRLIMDALQKNDAAIVSRTKDGRVRINIRAVVPEGFRSTTTERHRRIREALNEELRRDGRSVTSRWIVEDSPPRE